MPVTSLSTVSRFSLVTSTLDNASLLGAAPVALLMAASKISHCCSPSFSSCLMRAVASGASPSVGMPARNSVRALPISFSL